MLKAKRETRPVFSVAVALVGALLYVGICVTSLDT